MIAQVLNDMLDNWVAITAFSLCVAGMWYAVLR